MPGLVEDAAAMEKRREQEIELEKEEKALSDVLKGDFTEFHQLSHKLKQISLFYLQFNDPDQFSSALYLLKSFPNLEKLKIKAFSVLNDGLEERDLSYFVNMTDSNLKLNCLQSVKLRFFTGLKLELVLVKLILSHSPMLNKMEIKSKGGMDADKELAISMQLMRFHRASAES